MTEEHVYMLLDYLIDRFFSWLDGTDISVDRGGDTYQIKSHSSSNSSRKRIR